MFRNVATTFIIAAAIILHSAQAFAQPYQDLLPEGALVLVPPKYKMVTGVASDDVLNIRTSPSASSQIIGSLAPGAKPVEVVATFGNWSYVVMREQNGWVSSRYLSDTDAGTVVSTPIALGTTCYGTEPFWGMTLGSDGAVTFNMMDEEETSSAIIGSGPFAARLNRFYIVAGEADNLITAFFSAGQLCSDGMSEREHGWSVQLLREADGDRAAFSGCCRRGLDTE